MNAEHAPVLVGAGQVTQRNVSPERSLGPLELMVAAARLAAADARIGEQVLRAIDSVAVVNIIAWHYGNAPRLLAEQLGAHPREEIYTTMGGNTPQSLVNQTAAKIAAGRVRVALLAGAEAVYSYRRARRAGVTPPWVSGGEGSPTSVGDARPGTSDHEVANGFQAPVQIYPLFENALRAAGGLDLAAHRERLGALCSRFSHIAAANPYAWFRTPRSAEEIATPSPANRLIGFPYTKYMNAVMDVDQSAAVLMTSAGHARALGIPPERWVYLWGAAEGTDRWFISERRDYFTSPALRAAGERAFASAGVSVERIRYFDLYSCFPVAVQLAAAMLGIGAEDERPLTVTGGLPYAGGPGSNYSMHAIATMMDRLRADPAALGLVTALGWYVTKHAVGIYSTAEPATPWRATEPYDDALGPPTAPALAHDAAGRARIETYTVMHDRDGVPMRGLVISRLDDGRRILANTPEDREVLEGLMAAEGVGRAGRVETCGGLARFEPL